MARRYSDVSLLQNKSKPRLYFGYRKRSTDGHSGGTSPDRERVESAVRYVCSRELIRGVEPVGWARRSRAFAHPALPYHRSTPSNTGRLTSAASAISA